MARRTTRKPTTPPGVAMELGQPVQFEVPLDAISLPRKCVITVCTKRVATFRREIEFNVWRRLAKVFARGRLHSARENGDSSRT